MKKAFAVAVVCLSILMIGSIIALNIKTVKADSEISILSHSSYVDSYGWLHVVGEVQNNGTVALNSVEITATFYNSSNTVVGTEYTYSDIDTINVEEKSPFEILFMEDTQVPKIDHYTLATDFTTTTTLTPALEMLSNSSYTDTDGWMHIVGEIQNNDTATANYVMVCATLYDSGGKVVLTGYTYTDPYDINSGDTAPFEIVMLEDDRVPMVASYSLNAQSNEYSLIPEWPNLLIMLAVLPILTGAILFGKKRARISVSYYVGIRH